MTTDELRSMDYGRLPDDFIVEEALRLLGTTTTRQKATELLAANPTWSSFDLYCALDKLHK